MKEDCMYIVKWKTLYDEGEETFFSEAQVKAYLAKHKKIFIEISVKKVK
jgi:hypothetical protein